MITEINAENIYEILNESEKPKCIKFYTPGCQPCKLMTPIVMDIAREVGDTLNVFSFNLEDEPEVAEYFGINSVPTFLFINEDGDKAMHTGAVPATVLRQKIKTFCGV